jgi:hypothetical protein
MLWSDRLIWDLLYNGIRHSASRKAPPSTTPHADCSNSPPTETSAAVQTVKRNSTELCDNATSVVVTRSKDDDLVVSNDIDKTMLIIDPP